MRTDSLTLVDLYPVLGYVLFDRDAEFAIPRVAVYSARCGHQHRWPLDELLETLAGEPVDLRTERAAVWTLQGGD